MLEPEFYSMSTITDNNLPWRWMVCGLHSLSIPIGYNRTYLHVCVRSGYSYNGFMPVLPAEPAPPGVIEQGTGLSP